MGKTNLEDRITVIEKRNAYVEKNKAWETSFVRRGSIAIFTYFIAGVFLSVVDITSNPWLNALVPTGGYLLSTMSLNIIRSNWEKNR